MSTEVLTNLYFSLAGCLLTAVAACAYGLRLVFLGRAQHSRIDKDGESALLGKGVKEMGYWVLQPVARFFIFIGFTANAVSYLSLFVGLASGIAIAYGYFGAAALLAMVAFLFDAVDGLVARITGQFSDAGEVLDASIDRYVEFFFLAGLVIFYRSDVVLQLIALLALLGSFMVSYSTAKAEALQVDPPRGAMRRTERAVYLTLGALLSPISIAYWEVGYNNTFRGYVVGYPMIAALAIVALLANFSAVVRLTAIAKAVKTND